MKTFLLRFSVHFWDLTFFNMRIDQGCQGSEYIKASFLEKKKSRTKMKKYNNVWGFSFVSLPIYGLSHFLTWQLTTRLSRKWIAPFLEKRNREGQQCNLSRRKSCVSKKHLIFFGDSKVFISHATMTNVIFCIFY